jgi:hypothetical protein
VAGLLTTAMYMAGFVGLLLTVYAAVDHSVRIRLCIEFHGAQGPLSYDEILKKYNLDEAHERRISKFITSGYFIESDGRFYLTSKGRRLGHVLRVLKKIYVPNKIRSEIT